MKERLNNLLNGRLSSIREYVLLAAGYLLSRLLFFALGLRFEPELVWMFLADPAHLRERPLETIFYFHAFPPGMNVHTAALLQFGEAHFATLAQLSFIGFGLMLVLCVFYLGKALGLGRWMAALLSLALVCTPPALLFENLYLYTWPSAALLSLASALFHRALKLRSTASWFGFFAACCVLGWYRSTFHLLWFGLMMLASVLLCARGKNWKAVLAGAALPATLLAGLYLKNLAVFGVFGATSWGGAHLAIVTTRQMPRHELQVWIRQGKISPLAGISVYAPPRAYARYLEVEPYPWPGTNEWQKPSNGGPNYNHGLFLRANSVRSRDSAYYIQQRPQDYLRVVVALGLPQFFSPSTVWHPGERHGTSPHARHHAALGSYETTFNKLVHAPIAALKPFGFYTLLPLVLILAGWLGIRNWRTALDRDPADLRARAGLLWFLVLQVVFVTTVSCLVTLGESSRYRFMVEANVWLLTAAVAHWAVRAWLDPKLHRGCRGRTFRGRSTSESSDRRSCKHADTGRAARGR